MKFVSHRSITVHSPRIPDGSDLPAYCTLLNAARRDPDGTRYSALITSLGEGRFYLERLTTDAEGETSERIPEEGTTSWMRCSDLAKAWVGRDANWLITLTLYGATAEKLAHDWFARWDCGMDTQALVREIAAVASLLVDPLPLLIETMTMAGSDTFDAKAFEAALDEEVTCE